ncbi:RiPP maturation radical SAM C-methyltransferase [Desulfocicer niacini]
MNLSIKNGDFIFAVMPWAYPDTPVLGTSLLQSILKQSGYRSQIIYPAFQFFHAMDPVFYYSLSNDHSLFELSEHLFSCYIHGKESIKSDHFLKALGQQHIEHKLGENYVEFLSRVRDVDIPEFIDSLALLITKKEIPAIGFSCTYNQVLASMALAKGIKKIQPEIKTIFGGPSLAGVMGIAHHQKYPDIIDHVFIGEADGSIVNIVDKILQNETDMEMPGLTQYKNGLAKGPEHFPVTQQLDDLPAPDFSDFFQQRNAMNEDCVHLPTIRPLPYESSRGCWWAEKTNCSFCGFNGLSRQYRVKSPLRVTAELEALSTAYVNLDFSACDNNINNSHFETLFPTIAQSNMDYSLWYQIRPDISKENIMALKRGKVVYVHAGIESFSDNVLKLMRKGLKYLENIQLLKWCREAGIKVSYMILWGIPGETPHDYSKMAALLPFIVHLEPPLRMQFIELHRFSPMFTEPDKFGIEETYIRENYRHVYPLDILEPDLFYYFNFYASDTKNATEYTKDLHDAVNLWAELHHDTETKPVLEMRLGKDFLLIHDNRCGENLRYFLNHLQKEILLYGDSICKISTIYDLARQKWPELSRIQIDTEFQTLKANGLIIIENDKYLSLPTRSVSS